MARFVPYYLNVFCSFINQMALLESLMDDVRKLKIIAKGHERRVRLLEEKLAAYEEDDDDDDDKDGEDSEAASWTSFLEGSRTSDLLLSVRDA